MTEDAPAFCEIELAPGYVCGECAYAISYAEWPGDWSEGEVAEREAEVAAATENGNIRFVVDHEGRDDLRDDTCQYHGKRYVGAMYLVNMARLVSSEQGSAPAPRSASRRPGNATSASAQRAPRARR